MTWRLASIGVCLLAGLLPGWLLAGSNGALVGGLVGSGIGLLADRFQIRTLVAAAVIVGTVVGAFIGRSVVATICLPGTCVGLEILGAVLIGVGAFVGVGIITALAMRSFEEYGESRDS